MEKKKGYSPRRSPSILPQSPIAYEQYKSWCSWGLIGLFRYKHGQSNKKKISRKAHDCKRIAGNGNSKSQIDLLPRFRDKCQCTDVSRDVDVESKAKKVSFSRMQKVKHDSEPVESPLKGERKRKKASDKVDSSKSKQISEPISAEKSVNECSEALEKVEDDKWSFKYLGDYRSKHFLNALDILSSNKELFSELLQDPTSLSQKRTQNSPNSQQQNRQVKSFFKAELIDPRDKLDEQTDCQELEQTIADSKNMRMKVKKQNLEHAIRVSNDEFQFTAADSTLTKVLSSNDNEDLEKTEIASRNILSRSYPDSGEVGTSSPKIKCKKDSSHMANSQTDSNEFMGNGCRSAISREFHTFKDNANRVFEATGLDWTDFHIKFPLSSDSSLQQQALLDEFSPETWRNQSSICDNHKLPSGYIDEVVVEIYCRCLKSYPCVAVVNSRYLPFVLMKDLRKCLEGRVVSEEPPPPSSLDRLTQKDMAGNWSWMDLRSDTEDVVTEIVELFLEDLGIEMANELRI